VSAYRHEGHITAENRSACPEAKAELKHLGIETEGKRPTSF
jgi:hypothetical protein